MYVVSLYFNRSRPTLHPGLSSPSCSQMFGNGTSNYISVPARGYLFLTLTQGLYALTELSDINPLDISTILGNIGGFWGTYYSPCFPRMYSVLSPNNLVGSGQYVHAPEVV